MNACGNSEEKKEDPGTEVPIEPKTATSQPDASNALAFVNGWVENCNKMDQAANVVTWVQASKSPFPLVKVD